jgi:hypothetical protein
VNVGNENVGAWRPMFAKAHPKGKESNKVENKILISYLIFLTLSFPYLLVVSHEEGE